jgi:histidinol-phosphate/aromatic aminotransferase/cobyric acid decarboxylase-like protein
MAADQNETQYSKITTLKLVYLNRPGNPGGNLVGVMQR